MIEKINAAEGENKETKKQMIADAKLGRNRTEGTEGEVGSFDKQAI